MYRRDYILRLIERFGQMLIALRNRILRRELDSDPGRQGREHPLPSETILSYCRSARVR